MLRSSSTTRTVGRARSPSGGVGTGGRGEREEDGLDETIVAEGNQNAPGWRARSRGATPSGRERHPEDAVPRQNAGQASGRGLHTPMDHSPLSEHASQRPAAPIADALVQAIESGVVPEPLAEALACRSGQGGELESHLPKAFVQAFRRHADLFRVHRPVLAGDLLGHVVLSDPKREPAVVAEAQPIEELDAYEVVERSQPRNHATSIVEQRQVL